MPTAQQRRDTPSIVAIADVALTKGQLVTPADGSTQASLRVAPAQPGEIGLGIVDCSSPAGALVHVFIEGVYLLRTTVTLEPGDFVTADVNGTVKKAAPGDPVFGLVLQDAAPNTLATIHIRQQMAGGTTGGSMAYAPADPSDWPDPDPTTVAEGLDSLADQVANLGDPNTFVLEAGFYHATSASVPDLGALRYSFLNGLRTPTMPYAVEIQQIVFQWVDEPAVAAREIKIQLVEPYPTKLNLSTAWTLDRTHPSVISTGSGGSARKAIVIDVGTVSPFADDQLAPIDFVIPANTPFPRLRWEHFGDVNHNPAPAQFENYGQLSAFFFVRKV